MPRGRPRKPRLSRWDAAVDAMAPMGFKEDKVKKKVKQLLKEYGGDECWPFIEECSYKVLLDALLCGDEGTNDPEQFAEDGNQSKSFEEGEIGGEGPDQDDTPPHIGGASGVVKEPEFLSLPRINSAEGDGRRGWKDILPDQAGKNDDVAEENADVASENDEDPKPSTSFILRLKPASIIRRRPCFGWIESDEEDNIDDFVTLTPMECGNKPERKRRSRWDQKPDDP